MDRTLHPSIGLFLIGLMMFVFGVRDAAAGQTGEVPLMAASTLGLWLAAFAVRDHQASPGHPLMGVGLTTWGVAQTIKFVLLLATPSVYLVPFGLLALGSAAAAVAAWRWYNALADEEATRMLPVRVSIGIAGSGLLTLLTLQVMANGPGVPSLLLLTGGLGAALFAVSFAAPTARAEGLASGEATAPAP